MRLIFRGLAGGVVLLSGCTAPHTGSTSAEILPPPDPIVAGDRSALDHATMVQGDTRTETLQASPIDPTPIPQYPPEALKAGSPDYTLLLTVTVDDHGRVSDIRRALGDVEIPNRFAAEFRQAAETALRPWKFVPARQTTYRVRPGKHDELIDSTAIPDEFDIRYTFTSGGHVR